jgi:hypothetical protein
VIEYQIGFECQSCSSRFVLSRELGNEGVTKYSFLERRETREEFEE